MKTLHDSDQSPVDQSIHDRDLERRCRSRMPPFRTDSTNCRWFPNVLSINSFVPKDQQQKLAQIEDAATLLGPTLNAFPIQLAPPTAEQIRAAANKRAEGDRPRCCQITGPATRGARPASCASSPPRPTKSCWLSTQSLTRFLPMQLDQLRTALAAQPVTLQSIPASLARDWLLPNGRARLQVLPNPPRAPPPGLPTSSAR